MPGRQRLLPQLQHPHPQTPHLKPAERKAQQVPGRQLLLPQLQQPQPQSPQLKPEEREAQQVPEQPSRMLR